MVETRLNELRYKTSDPIRMLNKWTAERVLRKWMEDFIDEDSGQVVTIERNEVLFEKGTLIDQDTLVNIRFYMDAGELSEVEVSNQKRKGYEVENNSPHIYIAQLTMDQKKHKFLLYASSLDTAKIILKDYVELNYRFPFWITMIKEFESCIILTDSLKEYKKDEPNPEVSLFDQEDKEESPDTDKDKKFYQIDSRISYRNKEEESEYTQRFVIHTFNTDRAMILIGIYLKKQEKNKRLKAIEHKYEYVETEYYPMIESAKTLPIGKFIPREFSMAYMKND